MMSSPDSAINLESSEHWRALLESSRTNNVGQFKAQLSKLIDAIDEKVSEQLSAVIQASEFKKLESSWRGIQSLIELPISLRRIRVKILDASWKEVANDVSLSFSVTQSVLYRKTYSQELDTAGGQPFGMMVVDHRVHPDFSEDSDYDDLYTLQLLSEVGERALCPVVLGVDPFFFGDQPERQLHDNARIARILDSDDYRSWQLLRKNSSSRFLHLVLPEYSQRMPWINYPAGFVFNEHPVYDPVLWGNPAYLLASNVLREFDRISWFGFMRAYDETASHGAILPENENQHARVDIFSEEDGFWSEQGFVSLTSLYLSGQKGFFSNQSVWRAPDEASRLLGMLQTNLMACRFGHYIKAQLRDQVGSFDSAADCKRSLERWIQKYISAVDYGDDAVMARYPLKSCEINLTEDASDVTRYLCEIKLQPQYQYEILDAQIVLSTAVSANEVGETA
ncbi:type VI secretion system contractile sheath large subunit [Enterovibrio sp. ZSDZ35]|uniref:Type VI secretion system contractile sheath large subunit n=1 Tax=Enterovibrio qingdaonensis TaxID=2899818 RepID=A0ABT5QSU3_9GAMM|nr:type VI secretion system contractile sheath large subunit [Enterovibrio sp. ZSDZ35]MDD1783979.1 type VI secretion system contractile sheath large subunit [Enterovibrio sp. ZSDZ35]